MKTTTKDLIMISFALVGAIAIIITAWIVNGSEKEDAWLYVFSIWLIIYSGLEVYLTRKINKDKDKSE